MKQTTFLPIPRREHGGSLALHKRRSRRSLDTKKPMHLVLRSQLAVGPRSLLKNKAIVNKVLRIYSKRFRIRVYEIAVCGNHIHVLVKGNTRRELQAFFRVFAGQIAQQILELYPLRAGEEKAFWGGTPRGLRSEGRGGTPAPGFAQKKVGRRKKQILHPKNQRTFWSLVIYSRVLTWGREYRVVKTYVVQNILEALEIIAYVPRKNSS